MNLYYADIREFSDLPGIPLLGARRQQRIPRYLKQDDQMRCLVAGLMLRAFAGDENQFSYTKYGKPCSPGGPCFNLSHSGNHVVLATDAEEMGVDTEQLQPWSPKVAAKCFVSPELDWLYAQEDTTRAFYVLWTAKESIMKANGAGFSMAPESFCVSPQKALGTDANGQCWRLSWRRLPEHEVCVATPRPLADVPLRYVSREELLLAPVHGKA